MHDALSTAWNYGSSVPCRSVCLHVSVQGLGARAHGHCLYSSRAGETAESWSQDSRPLCVFAACEVLELGLMAAVFSSAVGKRGLGARSQGRYLCILRADGYAGSSS